MYQQRVDLALKGCARAETALQIATDELGSVAKDLVFARSQRRKAVRDQNQEGQSMWDQNIKEAEKSVDKAKRDVDKAEEQFQKAAERLKEEEAKVSAAAPAQAGGLVRFCMCSCCCCLWFALPQGRLAFSCGPPFGFLGSCSPLGKDPLVVKLSPLRSLGAFRSGGALGCFRFHKKMRLHLFYRVEKAPLWLRQRCYANLICTRVLPMLQNGVSIL